VVNSGPVYMDSTLIYIIWLFHIEFSRNSTTQIRAFAQFHHGCFANPNLTNYIPDKR
jgi:hypothetical protein